MRVITDKKPSSIRKMTIIRTSLLEHNGNINKQPGNR